MGSSESKPAVVDDRDEITILKEQERRIDKLQAELPRFIDEQSRQQVEDYKQACNDGKGPMVACFSTAQFISLYDMNYKGANNLYHNVCFRPKTDKSPNGVMIDGTMSYPAGCFNLARNLITGKGIEEDRVEAYKLLDRGCRGGHGGACFIQAKILCNPIDSFAAGLPFDPKKAMELYEVNCLERNDSFRYVFNHDDVPFCISLWY
jgi:TPR repeat protein